MAASSGMCTENEVKNHDYQLLREPGPRGAYEARQVNGGLYVRVDMPGVPPDGLKLFKRSDTHTVTFTGKAPRLWPDCETSDRVYGGYVVLDRNPNDIDIEMTLVNGSLKLFFPNADGLLHFFPQKNAPQQFQGPMVESTFPNIDAMRHFLVPKNVSKQSQGPVRHIGDEKECCHNNIVQYVATLDDNDPTLSMNPGLKNMELHPRGCSCCKDGHMTQQSNLSDRKEITHINPSLLDGVKGVEEYARIVDATGERLYMRVDMPGVGEKNGGVIMLQNGATLVSDGKGEQEHPFDEGGHTYAFGMMLQCTCCKIVDMKHAMKHGVSRVSCRRLTISGSSRKDYCQGQLALIGWA